jgi:hypothetical protein
MLIPNRRNRTGILTFAGVFEELGQESLPCWPTFLEVVPGQVLRLVTVRRG